MRHHVYLVLLLPIATLGDVITTRLAHHDLELHSFPLTGRGLRTQRDRASGEVLLSFPDDAVIIAERVLRQHEDLKKAAAHAHGEGATLSDDAVIACFLAQETRDNQNYVSTLPSEQPSVIGMVSEDLALLPRCYSRAAEAMHEHAVRQHEMCTAAMNAVGQSAPPLEAFLRSFAHVRARSVELDAQSFGLEARSELLRSEQRRRRAMLPLFDLVNHRPGARTRLVRVAEAREWRLYAEDAYSAGEQVFVSYGDSKDNLRLLLHYGFAIGDNPGATIGFDVIDLVDGCVAALPHVFGAHKEALLRALLKQESAQRKVSLTVYTVDAATGQASEPLQTAFAILEGMVTAKLGGSEEDAASLAEKALAAMLSARLDELNARLEESTQTPAPNDVGLRHFIVTLMQAEHKSVQQLVHM